MRWVIMNYQNEMTRKPSLGQQAGGRFSIGTRQNGAALVTGLIFLVILTLLGVTAMQTSIMEERMAGNARDRNIAFQAAEAALRNAEADIFGAFAARLPGTTTCTGGVCCAASPGLTCAEPSTPVYQIAGIWDDGGNSVIYGANAVATAIAGVARQPRYLVEPFGNAADGLTYRITARGYGANVNTQVTLQTVYR